MNCKLTVLLALSFFLGIASISAVLYQTSFSEMNLLLTKDSTDTYDIAKMEDLCFTEVVGAPQLPAQFVNLIIPADMEVDDLDIPCLLYRYCQERLLLPAYFPAPCAVRERTQSSPVLLDAYR